MDFNFEQYKGFYITSSSYNFIEHLLVLELLESPEKNVDSLQLTISEVYDFKEDIYHDFEAESLGNMEAIKIDNDAQQIHLNTGDAIIQFKFTSNSTVEVSSSVHPK